MFYSQFYDEYDEWFDEWLCDDEHTFERDNSFCISDYQTSDTLIIHPDDPTTDFLSAIYEGKGWDVINDPFVGPDIVEELIDTHDKIVCLGHGSPAGLFGGYGFLIHDDLVPLLKNKEMVSIWCYASEFMDKHGLQGVYSGMFISETGEAYMNGITNADQKMVDASNNLFSSVLGKYIDSENVLELVKKEYVKDDDPIVSFNRARLYSR